MRVLLVHPAFPVTYWGFQHALPIIDKRATPSERVQVLGPVVARFFAPELSVPLAISPPVRELLLRLRPAAMATESYAQSEPSAQLAG